MLLAAMAFVLVGYTLAYYGISMFEGYNLSSKTTGAGGGSIGPADGGIPFGVLLGVVKPTASSVGTSPPFNFTGSTSTGATPSSNPTTATTGGGVQSV